MLKPTARPSRKRRIDTVPELLGYQVEKQETDESRKSLDAAYTLSDKKGPKYKLLRNKPHPEMLFALHARKFGCAKIKGYTWLTDKDGELKPLR